MTAAGRAKARTVGQAVLDPGNLMVPCLRCGASGRLEYTTQPRPGALDPEDGARLYWGPCGCCDGDGAVTAEHIASCRDCGKSYDGATGSYRTSPEAEESIGRAVLRLAREEGEAAVSSEAYRAAEKIIAGFGVGVPGISAPKAGGGTEPPPALSVSHRRGSPDKESEA